MLRKTGEPFDRPRQKGGFPKRSASHYQRRVASAIHVSESNKVARQVCESTGPFAAA
jgi:hypothetical protein